MSSASLRRRRIIGLRILSLARKRRSSSAMTAGSSPTICASARAEVFAGNGFQVVLTPVPDAHAVGFLRGQGPARHRRRDDHRQPQSAGLQRLQAQVPLRRLGGIRPPAKAVEKLPGPQPGPPRPWPRLSRHKQIRITDVRPAHYAALKTARGFQAHRQVQAPLRPRSAVRRRRGLLRGIAGGHDLQGHDA